MPTEVIHVTPGYALPTSQERGPLRAARALAAKADRITYDPETRTFRAYRGADVCRVTGLRPTEYARLLAADHVRPPAPDPEPTPAQLRGVSASAEGRRRNAKESWSRLAHAVRSGRRPSEVARDFGVSERTVRTALQWARLAEANPAIAATAADVLGRTPQGVRP